MHIWWEATMLGDAKVLLAPDSHSGDRTGSHASWT